MIRIVDKNAFYLRMTGKTRIGEYETTLDMNVIDSLIVNFVRRGRIPQTYTIDANNRVQAYNSGILAKGVYGVEFVGYYNGQPWRHFASELFAIVDSDGTEPDSTISNIDVFDVTIYMKLSGDGVTADFVQAMMEEHNADALAHTEIRGEIPTKTSDLNNDARFQTEQQVQQKVNTSMEATKINQVQVDVVENGGQISADGTVNGQKLNLILRNFKGEKGKTGEKGETGATGATGPQGATSVYDSTTQNFLTTLETTTGQDQTKTMTQKAITDELIKNEKSIGEWEDVKVSLLPKANCYPTGALWRMRTSGTGANEQRHIAISVTGGDQILLTCVSCADGSAAGAKYAWLTSDYDNTTPSDNANLPLASGETEARTALIADGEMLVKAPTDAAYLCLTIAAWGGSAATMTWKVMKKHQVQNLSKQVEFNTQDCDEISTWVDHGDDVALTEGYISGSTGLWTLSSTYVGKLIPAEQYAGKRIRLRVKNNMLRFAFLSARPPKTGGAVQYCVGWGNVVVGLDYDAMLPLDCKYIYVYAYSNGTDVTPYVETRESIAKNGVVFTPTEKVDLSELDEHLCSLGSTYFYYKSTPDSIGYHAQRHIAVPVEPGDVMRVRGIDGGSQVIVATDDYDPTHTYQVNDPIPMAEGWKSRSVDTELVFTVPSDGAYLLMTTKGAYGLECTYEVEKGVVESKSAKDLPLKSPVKLRVVQWNIGGFTHGDNGGDQGYDFGNRQAQYYIDLPIWKDTINDMDADVICCCEYNEVMLHGAGGDPDVIAREEIFGLFKHAYIQPKLANYMMTAIFSHMRAESITRKEFDAQRSYGNPVHRYYESAKYNIANKDVYVVATHLETGGEEDAGVPVRLAQMDELIDYASDKEYVIICADFNASSFNDDEDRAHGSEQYNKFLEAGFKMANHGYLGDFNTGEKVYSILDNIIVKGFDVSNIKIYDDPNNTSKQVELVQEHQLSDHAAIGCTLTMLD